MILKLGRWTHQQRFWFAEGSSTWQIRLYKPHFQKYFNNDVSQIDKQVKQIAKKYSLNKRGLQKLFKLKPQVFISNSQQRVQLEQKIKFLNSLEETEPLARLVNDLLFDSHHLLMTMNQQDILNFISHLKQYGFDQNSASNLFATSSNLIHNKFDLLYQAKLDILKDYLQLNQQQALQIFVHQPFLLTCSTDILRESVGFFVEKSYKNSILTRQAIIKLLQQLGEIFLIGRQQLSLLLKWYKNWGIQKDELWTILLEHPLLLLNHPGQIFHFKAKMFRQFRFTTTMGQILLRKYPSALICSVRALESKFLVARDRLKIKLDENNLEYLTFKFGANLRPRAEMLIRGKVPYTSQDIVEYLKCSQQEFIKKTGIPKQKFQEQKFKYSITAEMDFPRKKCLKNYPSEKKIFEHSERYYSKEDLIIKAK